MPLYQVVLEAISNGFLLAGVVVGTWEFGEFVRPWIGRFGPAFAALIVPWGLLLVGFSHIPVPWGIYAVVVSAVWLWEPKIVAVSATFSFIFAWEVNRWLFNPTLPIIIGGSILLLCAAVGYVLDKSLRQHPVTFIVTLYATIVVLIVFLRDFFVNADMTADIISISLLSLLVGLYSVFRNNRTRSNQRLHVQATRDPLTGALTRNGLSDWLHKHVNSEGAIFAIDLDDFKPFNDLWGHTTGDLVLKNVVKSIQSVCRDCDAIVRPGGDEFTVWVLDVSPAATHKLAHRLHEQITKSTMELPHGSCTINASLGWATGSLKSSLAEEADQALLKSKRTGKNQVCGVQEDGGDPELQMGFSWWELESMRRVWHSSTQAQMLTTLSGDILVTNPAYDKMQFPSPTAQKYIPKSNERTSWLMHKSKSNGTIEWAVLDSQPILKDRDTLCGFVQQIEAIPSKTDKLHRSVKGLDDIRIRTVFQPIVDIQTGSLLGFEALSRPQVEELDLTPDELFSLATYIDQTREVDEKCLITLIDSLRSCAYWPKGTKLFVNVRGDTIAGPSRWSELANQLAEIVGVSNLVWELSEQSSSTMKTRAIDALEKISPHSAWAIDDWGAGYNSVSMISNSAPNWIKLDKGWIQTAFRHKKARRLLSMFINWTQQEGILTVAEGIETDEEAAIIKEWGISAGQGYLWGHPNDLVTSLARINP